jgi:hypothetical protein
LYVLQLYILSLLILSSLDAQGERPRGWDWVDVVKVKNTSRFFFFTHWLYLFSFYDSFPTNKHVSFNVVPIGTCKLHLSLYVCS